MMEEAKIMGILDKYDIAWSWMGDCVFVGKDRVHKLTMDCCDELLKVTTCRQGYDKEGNYIAFRKGRK